MLFFKVKAKNRNRKFVADRFYVNIAFFSQNFMKINQWAVETSSLLDMSSYLEETSGLELVRQIYLAC